MGSEEIASKSGVSIIAIEKIKAAGYDIRENYLSCGVPISTSLYIINLKDNEPSSDNQFFRTNIIMYELGDLVRSLVYAERFKDSDKVLFRDNFKDKRVILAEGKLAMSDLLTQLFLLCLSLGWDWEDLRLVGANHLEERQKDFKRDGWCEVKK